MKKNEISEISNSLCQNNSNIINKNRKSLNNKEKKIKKFDNYKKRFAEIQRRTPRYKNYHLRKHHSRNQGFERLHLYINQRFENY